MDLSFLIPSKTRRTVLDYFVKNPEAQIGVRELARELGLSPQLIHRELTNLESWGFLFSSKVGMTRSFRRNTKFVLGNTINDIFNKYSELRSQKAEIIQVLDWNKMRKEYSKTSTPEEWIKDLQSKRKRPRSYNEEKALRAIRVIRLEDIIMDRIIAGTEWKDKASIAQAKLLYFKNFKAVDREYLEQFAKEEGYQKQLQEIITDVETQIKSSH